MSAEEKIESLVAELRILESYFNEVSNRENMLGRAMVESKAALQAVRSLPQTGLSEVLVPVGGGVLMHVQVPPPESLIVSVGADVAVEKTRDDAVSFLDDRVQEMEKAMSQLGMQRADLGNRINSTRMAINSLVEQSRSG